MSLNITSAVDAILGRFKTQWDADTPAITTTAPTVVYESIESTLRPHPSDTSAPWVRVTIRHATSRKATLNSQTARYRRTGFIFVQVFVPWVDGTSYDQVDLLAAVAQDAFEGKTAGDDDGHGVVFTNAVVKEMPKDGIFLRRDCIVEYYWDSIKE